MNRTFLLTLCVLALAADAIGGHLLVDVRYATSGQVTNRRVALKLQQPGSVVAGPWLVAGDYVVQRTDTTGQTVFSNVLAGGYSLTIYGSPERSFSFGMPDTNGLVSAASLVGNTNTTPVYYTAPQVDLLVAALSVGAPWQPFALNLVDWSQIPTNVLTSLAGGEATNVLQIAASPSIGVTSNGLTRTQYLDSSVSNQWRGDINTASNALYSAIGSGGGTSAALTNNDTRAVSFGNGLTVQTITSPADNLVLAAAGPGTAVEIAVGILTGNGGGLSNVSWMNLIDIPTTFKIGDLSVTNNLLFEGSTIDGYETSIAVVDPTANRTISFPNASGTVALTLDLPGVEASASIDVTTNGTTYTPRVSTSQTNTWNAAATNAATAASNGVVSFVTAGYQTLDADLTDLADGSLTGSKIGTGIDAGSVTSGTLGNARLASTVTTNNGTLTSGRVQIGDGGRGVANASASGAVPLNADGSASTSSQIGALFTGGSTYLKADGTTGTGGGGSGLPGTNTVIAYGDEYRTNKLEIGPSGTTNAGPLVVDAMTLAGSQINFLDFTATGSYLLGSSDGFLFHPSADTTVNMGWLGYGIEYGVAANYMMATNGFGSGPYFTRMPTNAPADNYVLTAAGTGGFTKWAATGGGGGGGGTNSGPITLSISGTNVAVNAATPGGCVTNALIPFRLTLTTNVLVQAPTGMLDRQTIELTVIQDGTGSRRCFMATNFIGSLDLTLAANELDVSTTANYRDVYIFQYRSANSGWQLMGKNRGFQ